MFRRQRSSARRACHSGGVTACVCVLVCSLWNAAYADQRTDRLIALSKAVDEHYAGGRFKDSERSARALLDFAEQSFTDRPLVIAMSLDALAMTYAAQARPADAEPLCKRSLAIREQVLGRDNLEVAVSLIRLGEIYNRVGRYADEEPLLRRALAIREKQQGPEHPDVAADLNRLGILLYQQGRFADSLPLCKRALEIREKALGPEDPTVAESLDELGLAMMELDNTAEAEALLSRGLAIREKKLGPNHQDVASSLRNLGRLNRVRGHYATAEEDFKRALKIQEAALGAGHPNLANILNSLGVLYNDQGRYGDAVPVYSRALRIWEAASGPNHPDVAAALGNLAIVYGNLGRLAEEESLIKRAMAIKEASLGADHPYFGASLELLALAYMQQGRNAEAEVLLKRVLEINKKAHGESSWAVARTLNHLANNCTNQERLADAESLYKQCLAISEQVFGDDDPRVAGVLANLAGVSLKQKRFDEAKRFTQRALAMTEKAVGPDHPDVALTICNLATIHIEQKQYDRALPLLDRAIAIYERSAVAAQARQNAYYGRAQARWFSGQKREAIADLRTALQLIEEQRIQLAGGEQERAAGFSEHRQVFEAMISNQLGLGESGDLEEAWSAAERSRARSLIDQLNQRGIDLLAGMPAAEAAAFHKRDADAQTRLASLQKQLEVLPRRSELSEAQRQEQGDKLEAELVAARQAAVDIYRDLRNASPAYRLSIARDFQGAGLAKLRDWSVENQALVLAYFLGQEKGYLFVVSPNRAPRLVNLKLDEGQLKRLGLRDAGELTFERMQAALEVEGTTLLELLSQPAKALKATDRLAALWNVLIPADVQQELLGGEVRRLVVVPDGPLALLPFETLVVEGGHKPKYLLDAGPPILYAPSATVLLNLIERPAVNGPADMQPVLTVGNPRYQKTEVLVASRGTPTELAPRSRYSALGGELSALPYSGTESGWVAEVFNKIGIAVGKLLQGDATEAKVRFNVDGRRMVHLACHGLTDQKYGNFFGCLALTPGPKAASDPADDGFLTLPEIYELNLKSCELAILSACQTNYGPQQKGEGVWALSRGFLVAGARRVVASNWLVDDEAAASLVSVFCSDLAKAEGKHEAPDYAAALHRAKKWVRGQEKWSSPYFWGTFVLVGPN